MHIALRLGLIVPLIVALFLPMFTYENGKVDQGWTFLLLGWLSLLDGNFAWFANIPLLLALIWLTHRPSVAIKAAVIAFVLGLSIFTYGKMGAIDSGKVSHITSVGAAAYIWLATTVIIIIIAMRVGD